MDEFEMAGKETKCKYNAMVDCRGGACLKCGWNPKAAQERIQRMMCKRIQNRGVSATYYDESMENKALVHCEACMYRSQYADKDGLYRCGGLQCIEGHNIKVGPLFACIAGKRRTDCE